MTTNVRAGRGFKVLRCVVVDSSAEAAVVPIQHLQGFARSVVKDNDIAGHRVALTVSLNQRFH